MFTSVNKIRLAKLINSFETGAKPGSPELSLFKTLATKSEMFKYLFATFATLTATVISIQTILRLIFQFFLIEITSIN